MCWSRRIAVWLRPGGLIAVLLVPAVLTATDRHQSRPPPKGEVVEIFSGIENGQLEVQLIPKGSSKCRLMVKNKTDKPLSVMLPQAFAGVPVLAQFQNNFNQNNLNQNNVPQAVGVGPFANPGMGPAMMNVPGVNQGGPNMHGPARGGPNMFPGPLFNVPPEKVGKLKLKSVCLDYGKPNPRPQIKYEIKPIASYTDKPGVAEVCAMLGRGEIRQQTAQLAAWHLNNDKSWKELAGIRHKVTFGTAPTYARKELEAAKKAAEQAVKLADERRKPSAGKSDSLSRRR